MPRRAVAVDGIVQGVGFRPFVHARATRLGLGGFVQNLGGAVQIEIEGDEPRLDQFVADLRSHAPPLARIDAISWQPLPDRGETAFRIIASERAPATAVAIPPDIAPCDACLAELFDPADRRHRYPFLNCTDCGPRLTIVTEAPYDRSRTTMAGFAMCPACRAEYDDPADRRFHAQPIACPACGPQLRLVAPDGEVPPGDPVEVVAAALKSGRIVAIKGLGGYHLACDARDAAAVAELRRRKRRDEKPFALMVGDLVEAERLCEIDDAERELLRSPRRPIVLLRARRPLGVADSVAPGHRRLGVMLPSTPMHHLLLRDMAGVPLVMTSGNRSDEPIAYLDDDALDRLGGIADLFLAHDRPIRVRCDDSVSRVAAGRELPLRRSRGDAPLPIRLPFECRVPTLAVGGHLKATFALGRGDKAILSHHLGDLDHFDAYLAFERDIGHYRRLFEIDPAVVAHDAHPDYASTRHALALGLPTVAVQHHHAHLASCMAENGLVGPTIGVVFDGAGYGSDGTIWGGEFLVGDAKSFRRAAHFRAVAMPGGERAVREPWRMALAYARDAGLSIESLERRLDPTAIRTIRTMLERNLNSPLTSSVGRLFDAVASLIGLRDRAVYEGQAAMELEGLAEGAAADACYHVSIASSLTGEPDAPLVVDCRPLVEAVASDVRSGVLPATIARRFHAALVEAVVRVCVSLRSRTGIADVALSGGVFANGWLSAEAEARLSGEGFAVYRHRLVPPNDGGLCLGQLAVAVAQTS